MARKSARVISLFRLYAIGMEIQILVHNKRIQFWLLTTGRDSDGGLLIVDKQGELEHANSVYTMCFLLFGKHFKFTFNATVHAPFIYVYEPWFFRVKWHWSPFFRYSLS